MAIQMKTSGVHHVALRVSNVERSKKFYCDTLGKDYVAFKDPDRIAWEFYMA